METSTIVDNVARHRTFARFGLATAAVAATSMFGVSGLAHADTTHTVVAGDTVSQLAQNNGVTTDSIVQTNHLSNPDLIHVGDQLTIKSDNAQKATPTQTSTAVNGQYTVKAGDTLSKIAQDNGTTVANLMGLNHLSSDLIYVGQVLQVSGTAQPVQQSAQTSAQAQTQAPATQSSAPAQSSTQTANYNAGASTASSNQASSTSYNGGNAAASGMNDNAAANWIAQRESGGSYTARNGRLA